MNKLVIWDFDGVIVPSWAGSYEVNKMNEPDLTEERHRSRFEGNIHYNHDVRKAIDEDKFDFWKHYIPKVNVLRFYEGIDKAIKDVAERYPCVIVSSGAHDMIDNYLKKHGFRESFKKIYGYEFHFSKVHKIEVALKEFESSKDMCMLITDTLGDVREAEEADIPVIAVTWGYHTPTTPQKNKSHKI